MNSYEARQNTRRDRLLNAADRAEAQANASYKRADLREEASGIPLGQPILVGHHSEGRHRRAIARADTAMRRSVEQDKRAQQLKAKAAAVGSGGISADDPDAVQKLKVKLAKLEALQKFMREGNKLVRKALRAGGLNNEDTVTNLAAALAKLHDRSTINHARNLLQPDAAGRAGFADYQLSNNSAEIRRLKMRISQLEKASTVETKRHMFQGVCEVVENAENNRLQFIFEGKPGAEIRASLKSHGFRWAPSQLAWQRQLTNGARYNAQLVLKAIGLENC